MVANLAFAASLPTLEVECLQTGMWWRISQAEQSIGISAFGVKENSSKARGYPTPKITNGMLNYR